MATALKVLKILLGIGGAASLVVRIAGFVGFIVLEGFDWMVPVGILAIVLAVVIGHVEKRMDGIENRRSSLEKQFHSLHGYVAALGGHPPPSDGDKGNP